MFTSGLCNLICRLQNRPNVPSYQFYVTHNYFPGIYSRGAAEGPEDKAFKVLWWCSFLAALLFWDMQFSGDAEIIVWWIPAAPVLPVTETLTCTIRESLFCMLHDSKGNFAVWRHWLASDSSPTPSILLQLMYVHVCVRAKSLLSLADDQRRDAMSLCSGSLICLRPAGAFILNTHV